MLLHRDVDVFAFESAHLAVVGGAHASRTERVVVEADFAEEWAALQLAHDYLLVAEAVFSHDELAGLDDVHAVDRTITLSDDSLLGFTEFKFRDVRKLLNNAT